MTDRAPPDKGGPPPLDRPRKAKRGFAAMDPEKRREIARRGGAAVPPHLRSYTTNRELARVSGIKGGKATHAAKREAWEARKAALAHLPRAERDRIRAEEKAAKERK